jgi:hypothetical protein
VLSDIRLERTVRNLFIALALTLLGGCGAVCENEIVQTVSSPSGKMKAVVFNRGCGATVGFSTQVSLLPASASLPNAGGNVLVVGDKIPLKIEWESDEGVRIAGQLDSQIFKREESVSGVQVAYAN